MQPTRDDRLDIETPGQQEDDMVVGTQSTIRLDIIRHVDGDGVKTIGVRFCVPGQSADLLRVQNIKGTDLADRFSQLVSFLITNSGEFRRRQKARDAGFDIICRFMDEVLSRRRGDIEECDSFFASVEH